MTTYRYKSDKVYADAVLRYYVCGFLAGLLASCTAVIPLLIFFPRSCDSRLWLAVLVVGATVHITTMLIVGNAMCLTFQAMAADDSPAPPEPQGESWFVPRGDGLYERRKPGRGGE